MPALDNITYTNKHQFAILSWGQHFSPELRIALWGAEHPYLKQSDFSWWKGLLLAGLRLVGLPHLLWSKYLLASVPFHGNQSKVSSDLVQCNKEATSTGQLFKIKTTFQNSDIRGLPPSIIIPVPKVKTKKKESRLAKKFHRNTVIIKVW